MAGCSQTENISTSYYILSQPSASSNNVNIIDVGATAVKVYLPEYLKQPYLVIETDEHKLHYSHQNMWAQSLAADIEHMLKSNLKVKSSIDKNSSNPLEVFIHFFHVNESGTVVLEGQFKNQNGVAKDFNIKGQLDNAGYQASVKVMSKLVIQLADQINKTMS